jgi:hypothetical protein
LLHRENNANLADQGSFLLAADCDFFHEAQHRNLDKGQSFDVVVLTQGRRSLLEEELWQRHQTNYTWLLNF